MKITVQANSGEFSFECEATERLLYAGLAQGLRLPYECATGTCGTCRGRVVQGSTLVEWEEAPGFARLKRAKGDVLMCQARPTADCVVRVPANLAADPDSPTLPLHRRGRIAQARRLVGDVVELDIVLSRPITFDAGQFVVLEVPGLQGGRAYSMVNYARDSDRLTFVIKQKPGGGFSDWLFGSEVSGAELDLFGPLGAATFRPAEGREHPVHRRRFRHRRHAVDPGARALRDLLPRARGPRVLRRPQPRRRLLSAGAVRPRRRGGRQAAGHAGALARAGRQAPCIRSSPTSGSPAAW